jgi:tripartite ATP-independent transporter DctM subunit
MSGDVVAVLGFVGLFGLMLLRVPVGIAMIVVGVGGFAALSGIGPAMGLLAHSPIRTATDYAFGLIPLFVLMGVVAGKSGISGELFRAANAWVGHRRGGLAMATFAACGGFSAICGSSVATAATMGQVALPEMRRYGYPGGLSAGVIAAGGTLGILIPPSVVLVLYGAITEQDIGRLFVAGFLPGLIAVIMYMATVQIIAWVKPNAVPAGDSAPWSERWQSLHGVWPTAVIFFLVVGGLYGGVFTPTEAAGMGASITLIVSWLRRSLSWSTLIESLVETVRTTGALFTVLIGALLFGYFLAVTQTPQKLADILTALPVGPYGVLLILLVFYLVMGCIMESLSLVLLTVPIVYPTIVALGFDPIWFGIIMVMTVELGLITPPFGINVFVINSIAKDVELGTIFRGVAPFIATDIVRLALLVAFPGIVLLLPRTM